MPATLAHSVRLDGKVIPPGTPETPELRARISNPRAWSGPSELEEVESAVTTADHVAEPPPTVEDLIEVIGAAVETAVDRAIARHFATVEAAVTTAASADEPAAPAAEGLVEPPRGGAGSGEGAWREYAGRLGIEVPADANRDDIVALVDARSSDS